MDGFSYCPVLQGICDPWTHPCSVGIQCIATTSQFRAARFVLSTTFHIHHLTHRLVRLIFPFLLHDSIKPHDIVLSQHIRPFTVLFRPQVPRRSRGLASAIMGFFSMLPAPRQWPAILMLALSPTMGLAGDSAADYYVRDLPGLPTDTSLIKMHAG